MTDFSALLSKNKIDEIMQEHDCIAIVGATASGKTKLAMHLAAKSAVEIIICDSVQVYRGFDIGSAKPSTALRLQVPHHLLDRVDFDEEYNAGRYCKEARQALTQIRARQRIPLLVGGCGLYLRALMGDNWHETLPSDLTLRKQLNELPTPVLYERLHRLDPQRATQIHQHDRLRLHRALELVLLLGKSFTSLPTPPQVLKPYLIYLQPARAEVHKRIAQRTQQMLAGGFIDEVKSLLAKGCSQQIKPMQSIGYRQVLSHLRGEINLAELSEKITIASRRYAKRQTTWFNKLIASSQHHLAL